MIGNIGAALASGAAVGFLLGLVGGGGSILATPLGDTGQARARATLRLP